MIIPVRGHYESTLLAFPGLVHGFSTKGNGDVRDPGNRAAFLESLGAGDASIPWMTQVHGNGVTVATQSGWVPEPKADDAVSDVPGFWPAVHTGDCTPILLADPQAKTVAAVHAGWKGTVEKAVVTAISSMVDRGAHVTDIRAAIGPHISGCCYAVDSVRAEAFESVFGHDPEIIVDRDGTLYADIGRANLRLLVDLGIPREHIDYDQSLCTHCLDHEFFSYRRKDEPFGEILSVIGYH